MDTATTYFAPRTCTMVQEGEPKRYASKSASPLTDYADAGGYVLIAEPGAGKTSAFKTEAARQGAVCATVRDFRTFEKAEWCGTTLFLDGLDEARAGTEDGRTPLDDIRAKLYDLGCPPVRLSRRWADWMAEEKRQIGAHRRRSFLPFLRLHSALRVAGTASANLLYFGRLVGHALKYSLMNVLLTGRVRVNVSKEVAA